MKKIFLSAAIFSALVMTSCGESQKTADAADDLSAKIENCTNPDSLKIYVKQAQDYAQKLISEGKTTEAQEYLDKIAPAIEKKDPSVKEAFGNLMTAAGSAIKDKTEDVTDAVDSTANVVADKAVEVFDESKDAVVDKAKDVKDAVVDKAKDVKDSGAKAVDDAKSKTADLLQKGADKINDK